MKFSGLNSILFGLALLLGCNPAPKKETNAIFANFSPETKAYKNELARQIKNESADLVYTFQKYLVKQDKEYLTVQVAGADFKATGLVLVTDWHNLEGIKQTKGLGYSGAELKGLEFTIIYNPAGAQLAYKNVSEIID